MPYLLRFVLILALLPFSYVSLAQGENNFWTFGYNAAINFNGPNPVPATSQLMSYEGCASICTPGGNLLFYSNGNSVWDRNHNVMPNGNDILSNQGPFGGIGSSTQGVAIVPFINDTNKYYVFVLESLETGLYTGGTKLRYNVIDMTLNGGLGDVVAGQKNIMLDTIGSERMIVAKGAGCYSWLLLQKGFTNQFVAWKIEPSGIHPNKVVSTAGIGFTNANSGELKISPDFSKIVHYHMPNNRLELLSFDRATGVVSNPVVIDTATVDTAGYLLYGIEFSPDNTKLYTGTNGRGLRQYNLSLLPNGIAVQQSKQVIAASGSYVGMRMGPNKKIYISRFSFNQVACINNPNGAGMACNLAPVALVTPNLLWGLGNTVVKNSKDTVHMKKDTAICFTAPFTYTALPDYYTYTWSNGNTGQSTTFNSPGTRTLIATDGCNILYDTIVVTGISIDTTLFVHQDTLCFNSGLTAPLTAPAGYQDYSWNNGATTAQISITAAGTYISTAVSSCVVRVDTFHIINQALSIQTYQTTTAACFIGGNSISLTAPAGYTHYDWNNGSQNAQIMASTPGIYYVKSTDSCTIRVDTFILNAIAPDTSSQTIDTTICFQQQVLLNARPGYDGYLWHNGGTQQNQWVNTATPAYVNGYNLSQCRVMTDTFFFSNIDFEVNLGNDTLLCAGDSLLLEPGSPDSLLYTWSNLSGDPELWVRQPGIFWLKVSKGSCSKTDTIHVQERPFSVDLGADTRLCKGERHTLYANIAGSSYQWNTGSTAPAIEVDSSGLYKVEVRDGNCYTSDSIYISFVDCTNCLILPNAFSPNGDGRNDAFLVQPRCPVANYQIKIYDRWGRNIFSANNLNTHWDGYINGRAADVGVYYYSIQITYDLPGAEVNLYKGEITLLK